MTKEQILADLNYASSIAKEGAETPLLGGPIGLMWGILLSVTFFSQWAILSDTVDLPPASLAFLWIGFALIGGLGSAILGQKIERKAGAHSMANRVENYVWIMFAAMMGSLFIGVVLKQILAGGTPQLFDIILIVGFAGQGMAYGVVAKMTKLKWVHGASLAGFIAAAICSVAMGEAHIYLIAAIATIFTIILPSVYSIKKAG